MIEVMLADTMKKDPMDYSMYWVQPKLDGIRALIAKRGSEVRVYGRNTNKYGERSEFTQSLPEITEPLRESQHDFILDCELISTDFLTLQTKVRTTTHHVDDPSIRFAAFDCLQLNESSLLEVPYSSRYNSLCELRASLVFDVVDNLGYGYLSQSELEAYLDGVVRGGGEGLILKNPMSTYKPGKRTQDWIKVLPYRECDIVFVDAVEGTGKYKNMLGALTGIIDGKKVNVGTGFDDEQRRKIWENRLTLFPINGKIKYKDKYPSGIPRMPVFLQFKED